MSSRTISGVARLLELDDLADETSTEPGLLECLREIGVITPGADGMYRAGDVIRVDAARSFLDSGLSVEKIGEAIEHGLFTFEYIDRFHPEPSPLSDNTLADLADQLGLEVEVLKSVYLALGLTEPPEDGRPTVEAEEILQRFVSVWGPGGEDGLVRAARLVGEPAQQLSEGWARLYVEKISQPLDKQALTPEERIQEIVATTEQAALLAPMMFNWLMQTHLRHAIDRANLEGIEETMAEIGLSAPIPKRPPAIAFVDISGYTQMTQVHGDTHAVRTSDLMRSHSQRAASRHGGRLVKLLGDGAMLYFEDVPAGVSAVVELVRALAGDGLEAHAGIHAGPVIEHDADFYGSTVNLTSRIAGLAGPGEIVVSGAVVDQVEELDAESLGSANLKGVDKPVLTYRLSPLSGH